MLNRMVVSERVDWRVEHKLWGHKHWVQIMKKIGKTMIGVRVLRRMYDGAFEKKWRLTGDFFLHFHHVPSGGTELTPS